MARRILIGGLVLVVLLALVAGVTTVLNKRNKTACQKLIAYVEQGKATDSYRLFSPVLQGEITNTDWAAQVKNLNQAYGNSSFLLTQTHEPDASGSIEYDYKLTNAGKKFNLACFATKSKQGTLIDAFSSAAQ